MIHQLFSHVIATLRSYDNAHILLRARKDGTPQIFEASVAKISEVLGLKVVWFLPEGAGRESTFHRDYRLVEGADQVIAYFSDQRIMEGGTGHVVEAALNREIPVTAWSVGNTGVVRVGEIELSDIDSTWMTRQ